MRDMNSSNIPIFATGIDQSRNAGEPPSQQSIETAAKGSKLID